MAHQNYKPQNSVLVISSHVIRGSVGARASVNILEQMGHPVFAMLTVTMPWQPDHGPSHRLIVPDDDFQAFANELATSPFKEEIAAVLTGYFASAEQVIIAAKLIKTLKKNNPKLLYMCDPIMGDERGLYVKDAIAKNIITHLLPLADIITPNRSELEYIAKKPLNDNQEIIAAIRTLQKEQAKNCSMALVTSAWPFLNRSTGNLLIHDKQILLAEHKIIDNPVSGLGDMTAALFLSKLLQGNAQEEALRFTSSCVYALLKETKHQNAYELTLETSNQIIMHAANHIMMRNIKENITEIESDVL